MSREFLEHLNGGSRGRFKEWLDRFEGNPRISWYPSAGEDFRDVMYLHPNYTSVNPALEIEPQAPDVFLHTDYFPNERSMFLDSKMVYSDWNTSVTVSHIEELPACKLPLDPRIIHFPDGSSATHRTLFLELSVRSRRLGNFSVPVLYCFSENAAFCAKKMIPNHAQISHVIHVRYGGGCGGGGSSSGAWLLHVLEKLKCEVFITDDHLCMQSGDEHALEIFPEITGHGSPPRLKRIRVLPGIYWSNHGDVSWCLSDK